MRDMRDVRMIDDDENENEDAGGVPPMHTQMPQNKKETDDVLAEALFRAFTSQASALEVAHRARTRIDILATMSELPESVRLEHIHATIERWAQEEREAHVHAWEKPLPGADGWPTADDPPVWCPELPSW